MWNPLASVIRPASLSLLLLLPAASIKAQYRIESWTIDNGLPQNTVRSIVQTRDGYLWLTTYDGIVQALAEDSSERRWIGVVGGLLLYENGKSKNLSSLVRATVTSILADRYGNVWVGSKSGLFRFNGERLVDHYTVKDGLPADEVTVLHEDRNGELKMFFGVAIRVVTLALMLAVGTSAALAQVRGYVTNRDDNTVSVIDTATNKVMCDRV